MKQYKWIAILLWNTISLTYSSVQLNTTSSSLLKIQESSLNTALESTKSRAQEYIVYFSIQDANGIITKKSFDVSDQNLYEQDKVWLYTQNRQKKEIKRQIIINVGVPKVRAHYDVKFKKAHEANSPITLCIHSVEKRKEYTIDSFGKGSITFEVWMRIKNIEEVNSLDYKYISWIHVANSTDTIEEAEKKIPTHYYNQLKQKRLKKLCCCVKTFYAIVLALLWSAIFVLISNKKDEAFSKISDCVYLIAAPFVSLLYLKMIIDPSGIICRQYFDHKKEYEIVWKKPGRWKSIICCAKEKKFNDGKTHLLPRYSYCLCTLFNNSLFRSIAQLVDKYYISTINKFCRCLISKNDLEPILLDLAPSTQLKERPVQELLVLGSDTKKMM